MIVRAIGPSLPVTGKLLDPTLELHNGNGTLVAANDNWKETQQAQIIATGVPPIDDRESALAQMLSPGNYTAVVAGKAGTTGVAPVEVFNIQ